MRRMCWILIWTVMGLTASGCQHPKLFRLRGARCRPGLLQSLHLPRLHRGAEAEPACGPSMGPEMQSAPCMSGEGVTTNDVIVNEYPSAPVESGVIVNQRPIVSGPMVSGPIVEGGLAPSAAPSSVPGPETAPLPQ